MQTVTSMSQPAQVVLRRRRDGCRRAVFVQEGCPPGQVSSMPSSFAYLTTPVEFDAAIDSLNCVAGRSILGGKKTRWVFFLFALLFTGYMIWAITEFKSTKNEFNSFAEALIFLILMPVMVVVLVVVVVAAGTIITACTVTGICSANKRNQRLRNTELVISNLNAQFAGRLTWQIRKDMGGHRVVVITAAQSPAETMAPPQYEAVQVYDESLPTSDEFATVKPGAATIQ
ncbi:unnamed protein product (mitochondrion) [Plasmodiophora brassicae]|uniref:Uncharacterized protein n=1 Tax=Plasmodiophora brassicae TaxID=37360 RepID=A0A0G4IJ24_PLABS|nr:hypothetical protein PBRA_003969 [Plasmodiophora brassicae]SPQ96349.1 unnamed protein product [Plasmodiophora brassicae]